MYTRDHYYFNRSSARFGTAPYKYSKKVCHGSHDGTSEVVHRRIGFYGGLVDLP